ncbi:MAG: riboflavin synthase [Acidobacteriota bacterium]|nr:riboflavin synthase [Acidobacteriota bacterium]
MFTGIVEEIGVIRQPAPALVIECATVLSDLTPGGSICVNGVCLTATRIEARAFSADLAPETIERSNLGALTVGSVVNLERPLTLSTRLSGHIVQGHVDGTGELLSLDQLRDGNSWLRVRVPENLDRYLVYKGSIAIDGVSLTIAAIEDCVLSAAIIPRTHQHTTLGSRHPGDRLNIECDMIAKHVEKLTSSTLRLPRLQSSEPDRAPRAQD